MNLEETLESGKELILRPYTKFNWSNFIKVLGFFLAIFFILLLLLSSFDQPIWMIFSIISSLLLTLILWKRYQDSYLKISYQCLEIKGMTGKKFLNWYDIQNFRLESCAEGGISFFIDVKNSKSVELGNFLLSLSLNDLTINELMNLLQKAKEKYSRLDHKNKLSN